MEKLLTVGEKYISVDAETDGLWGNAFSVAAVVYEVKEEGVEEIDKIALRLPNEIVKNKWVKENVLPTLTFPITNKSYEGMLKEFSVFYMKYKDISTTIWHMGHIVEAHLFREMHKFEQIGDWDAPYTPIEVSDFLRFVNKNCDSVDEYYESMKEETEMNSHNPLHDCRVTGKVFFNILKEKFAGE